MKREIVFLCNSILGDENRAQFNRTKFLCEAFSTHIVSMSYVSKNACKNATSVHLFPYRRRIFQWLFALWSLLVITKLSRKHRFELLWSTYQPRIIVVAFLARSLTACKWVADIWDDPEKSFLTTKQFSGWRKPLALLLKKVEFLVARRCLLHADRVLTILGKKIEEKYLVLPERTIHITNGINLKVEYPVERKRPNGRFTLFYCGTVDQVRLEGLIPVLMETLKSVPFIHLVLVGYELNEGYEWVESAVKALGARVSLENRGVQPFRNVIRAVADADVCLCPYPDKLDLAAAIPVKLLDYMAVGRPIVASALPGVKRILEHGRTGMLFEPGDYREMAQHIVSLYLSQELRERLSANARKAVVSFDWDKIHAEVFQTLKGL